MGRKAAGPCSWPDDDSPAKTGLNSTGADRLDLFVGRKPSGLLF